MNYLGNVSVLTDGWYSLWTQHTLFSASLFLPAQFGVFCAWQWRLEHSGSNWNACRSAPISAGALYGSKFLLAVFVSALAQVCIGGLYVLGGRLAGLTGPVPAELVSWLLGGFVGGVTVCSVQLFLSLILRVFALPVGIGLAGGLGGMLLLVKGYGLYFPYSLLCLGMRANNTKWVLPVGQFLVTCLLGILVFSFLSIQWIKKRDVTTG